MTTPRNPIPPLARIVPTASIAPTTSTPSQPGWFDTSRREAALAMALCLGLLLALFGPSLAQHAHYHAFADQRVLWGMPFAIDVLSNWPFALAGAMGLITWIAAGRGLQRNQDPTRHFAAVFFVGLIVTALASSHYHLNPNDASLAIDRLGMVLSFAGMLGLATAQRVSLRAGLATVVTVLVLGPLSVAVWSETSNLLPWAVLQGGGLMLLLVLAACRPLTPSPAVAVLPVVAIYALAKLLELADQPIFELTQHLVSGHSLKHVVAAFAAWPVVSFMHNLKQPQALKKRARTESRGAIGLNRSQNTF